MTPIEDNAPSAIATPEEINALRDVLKFGKSEVATFIRADGEPDFRALIIALYARASTTLQALVLLVENGYGQQAMILNRAVFELLVDAYWIDANRDLAAERFVQHARFQQHLQREGLAPYADRLDLQIPEERLGKTELTELRKLYRRSAGSWTGRSVKERVENIIESFDEEFDREQLRTLHDIVYRLDNQELHPSPWSLKRVLRRVPFESAGEMLQFRIAPEPELGPHAVRCGWWMYLQVLHLLIDLFEAPLEDALDRLREEAPWARSQ